MLAQRVARLPVRPVLWIAGAPGGLTPSDCWRAAFDQYGVAPLPGAGTKINDRIKALVSSVLSTFEQKEESQA